MKKIKYVLLTVLFFVISSFGFLSLKTTSTVYAAQHEMTEVIQGEKIESAQITFAQDGQAMSNAQITGFNQTQTTNRSGTAEFENIVSGKEYTIRVVRNGRTLTQEVIITTPRAEIELTGTWEGSSSGRIDPKIAFLSALIGFLGLVLIMKFISKKTESHGRPKHVGKALSFFTALFIFLSITASIFYILSLSQRNTAMKYQGSTDSTVSAADQTAGTSFLETFDGDPTSPQPYVSDKWHITQDISHFDKWENGVPMPAQHGHDCGAPPATHTVSTWVESVFNCRNHLMTTTLSGDAYAATYIMPNRMIDFTDGPATLTWDMSTLVMSARDWVDVWVTPFNDTVAVPGEEFFPAFQGEPVRTITIRKDGPQWFVRVLGNGSEEGFSISQPSELVPSATVRTTFKLTVSKTSVKFEIPQYGVSGSKDIAALNWSKGVVQFGHHSYNPLKAENPGVAYATWHWDNVGISPAAPFTMIKVSPPRIINDWDETLANTAKTATFSAPAPAGSKLMFDAVCRVELNFGSGWNLTERQPTSIGQRMNETASSYLVNVPTGATSVQVRFKGDGWFAGFPCLFESPLVMNTTASDPISLPTPTPTTGVIINTPVPTATPTPTSTPTPIPPTPTSTPTPTISGGVGGGPTLTPTPTSTQTGGTGCGLANAAFCENFEGTRNTNGNRNGDFSTSKFSASRWHSELTADRPGYVGPAQIPPCRSGSVSNPLPPGDTLICDPTSTIQSHYGLVSTAAQNYGDNSYRIAQQFDITNRTGVIRFDTSLISEGGLHGWPTIAFTEKPYNAPSYLDDNSKGATPEKGIQLHFNALCATGGGFSPSAKVRIYDQYQESLVNDQGGCTSFVSTGAGKLNRVEVRLSQSLIEVWISDASNNGVTFGPLRKMFSAPINLKFSRGNVYFGVHNHATEKYANLPSWTVFWDNITFDGPVITPQSVYQVNDSVEREGPGVNLAYSLPNSASGGSTPAFSIPNVVTAGVNSGNLLFNVGADPISNSNYSNWRFNYSLNGKTWHPVAFAAGELTLIQDVRAGTYMFSVPIDVNELANGTNSVRFSGTGFYAGYQPYIGEVDLVLSSTAQPPTNPTPTPAPVACDFVGAAWNTQNVTEGQQVTLNVTGNAACSGKQVSFVVTENDSIAEGIGDDPTSVQPVTVTFNGTQAAGTWISEYQQDGLLGISDPPEYFFVASLVDDPSKSIRSVDPLLSVTKSGGTGGTTPTATATPETNLTVTSSITDGSTLSGSVSWTATTGGAAVSKVEFFVDNALKWTENAAVYQYNGDPDGVLDTKQLSNGSHVLSVKATSTTGASTTATSTVTISNAVQATATPVPTSVPTPTPGPAGTGLTGNYYSNSNFSGTRVTRIDPTVDFDWVYDSPGITGGTDTYSIRWTGKITAPSTGTYTFYTNADDGTRLWVNGTRIISDWNDHSARLKSGTISLQAGQTYTIRLDYYENRGRSSVKLLWSSATIPFGIIPSSVLINQ